VKERKGGVPNCLIGNGVTFSILGLLVSGAMGETGILSPHLNDQEGSCGRQKICFLCSAQKFYGKKAGRASEKKGEEMTVTSSFNINGIANSNDGGSRKKKYYSFWSGD